MRATIRHAVLEFATLAPTVVLWGFVLGAADAATMFVLWAVRVVVFAGIWARMIAPARLWLRVGDRLADDELLAIDEAMADNPRRFNRIYTSALIATMLLGTTLSALGIPRPTAMGPAELVCSAMFAIAVVVLLVAMQSWLWDPFEPCRITLGSLLRERTLVARRKTSTIVRSQLLLSAGSTLAMFIGCFGLGGMVHIQGRRATALAERRHHAELGALQIRSHADERPADVVVIAGADLPALLEGESPLARLVVGFDRSEAIAASPIGDGRWVLARAEVDEQLGWFVLIVLATGACLAVPMTGASVAQARSLADQLVGLGKLTRRVSETGKIRGLTRVVSLRNDEVDVLVRDFNAMLDMFDELTDAASKVAEGDLRVTLERPGDLHDAFRAMVERLHEMVVQIRTTSLDLASAAAEIHSITQEQAGAAGQQSAGMRAVSDTVASLAASAENITQTAAAVLDDADHTLTTNEAMITKIGELSRQAASVGQLLDLIREIADRSDLLALNGSLEATRVGEVGRGFALVAAEMRRLAERVTQTVGDVRKAVVEIKASGVSTVMAAEVGRKLAEQTAAAARHISVVTGRQSREMELVAQTVRHVAEVVIATAGATSQTRAAAEGLRFQAEQLERLTRQFKLRSASSESPS
ncbi:methyl-accepting chemotaxis protein [Nannocystaceae bacterium ST9]